MKVRRPLRLAALTFAAALGLSAGAYAQSDSGGPTGAKVPMHPSALTLKSHTGPHAKAHHRRHNYVHDTLHQPTPVHGTMAGPRM